MLTQNAIFSNENRARFPGVFQVLRFVPNRRERENTRTRANAGAALDHNMGNQLHVIGERDVLTNDAVWANCDPLPDLRAGVNDGSGMDRGGQASSLTIIAAISASA